MKLKLFLAASAIAMASFAATTAAATCWGCSGSFESTGTFNYGAGGEAENQGTSKGNYTFADSVTTKQVYGGGDATSTTAYGGYSGADAYAGSHFTTEGISGAISMGHGHSKASSTEFGVISGGGMASTGVTRTWGH